MCDLQSCAVLAPDDNDTSVNKSQQQPSCISRQHDCIKSVNTASSLGLRPYKSDFTEYLTGISRYYQPSIILSLLLYLILLTRPVSLHRTHRGSDQCCKLPSETGWSLVTKFQFNLNVQQIL